MKDFSNENKYFKISCVSSSGLLLIFFKSSRVGESKSCRRTRSALIPRQQVFLPPSTPEGVEKKYGAWAAVFFKKRREKLRKSIKNGAVFDMPGTTKLDGCDVGKM